MSPERGGTEVRLEGIGGAGEGGRGPRCIFRERRWFGRCCVQRGLVLRRCGVYITCGGGGGEGGGVLVNL